MPMLDIKEHECVQTTLNVTISNGCVLFFFPLKKTEFLYRREMDLFTILTIFLRHDLIN